MAFINSTSSAIQGHHQTDELIYARQKSVGSIWLAKNNKSILTHPAMASGEEHGLLLCTAAGNLA